MSKIRKELQDREFRALFGREFIQGGLAFQIRALRKARGWTPSQMARKTGLPITTVRRLEDPDERKSSMLRLCVLAAAFDVALMVRFVSFDRLLDEMDDLSPEVLAVQGGPPSLTKEEEDDDEKP